MHFSNSLVALAMAALTSAQTWTLCNPTKDDGCTNNPAMKETFETDFRGGAASIKGWNQTAGSLSYTPAGAEFTISKKGESPTIQSETYLFFGYVEIKMKASAGQGIISSIVLQSEDLDEVDWEFLGTDSDSVQMNYFGKGNTTVYDRMIEGAVSKPQDEFHTYGLDWKPEALTWLIDGVAVRTLKYEEANGGKNFPQTPSTVRIGIWAGGDPDNEEGVISWAGGETDYSKAPFTMTVESVKVKNYNPGKEYKWTDKSGDFKSIEVVGKGNTQGAPQNEEPIDTKTPEATSSPSGVVSSSKDHGLGSLINIPSGSAKVSHDSAKVTSGAAATSTCTKAKGKKAHATYSVPTTASPSKTPDYGSDDESDSECSCGTVTVTVTGSNTPPAPSKPAITTPVVPILTTRTPVKDTTSARPSVPVPSSPVAPPPVPSSPVAPPPVVTVSSPAVSAPATSKPVTSPPTSRSTTPTGLVTDTKPSPSAPKPSFPVGGNQTTTSTPPLFTGAAGKLQLSGGVVGVLVGALGVLMV